MLAGSPHGSGWTRGVIVTRGLAQAELVVTQSSAGPVPTWSHDRALVEECE